MKEVSITSKNTPVEITRGWGKKEILKHIRALGGIYDTDTVFCDFVMMAADAISNAVDKTNFEAREKDYLDRINRYRRLEERQRFPEMLAALVVELDMQMQYGKIVDVLGDIFNELELFNKYRGQFFTPQGVSDMMAAIVFPSDFLEGDDYRTLYEPCCGAGTMIYSFANECRQRDINYQRDLLVMAADVDLKCVAMTYIQCALYGIPAVVLHQNVLTLETWSAWYTPMYIVGGFARKEARRNAHVRVEHTEDGPRFIFNFRDEPAVSGVEAEHTPEGWQFKFKF